MSPSDRIRDRPTSDLIVFGFAATVMMVILTAVICGTIWRINDPNADIDALVGWVGDLTNTLIGAVVGYLAGRGVVVATNSNGTTHNNKKG
jgi:hypothetical protein